MILGSVDHHADDDPVKGGSGPFDDVDMSQGDGIKAPGIDGGLHGIVVLSSAGGTESSAIRRYRAVLILPYRYSFWSR